MSVDWRTLGSRLTDRALLEIILDHQEQIMTDLDKIAADEAAILASEAAIKTAVADQAKAQQATIDSLTKQVQDMTAADATQAQQIADILKTADQAKTGADDILKSVTPASTPPA